MRKDAGQRHVCLGLEIVPELMSKKGEKMRKGSEEVQKDLRLLRRRCPSFREMRFLRTRPQRNLSEFGLLLQEGETGRRMYARDLGQ